MLKKYILHVKWMENEFLAKEKIFSWLKSYFPSISQANIYFLSLGKKILYGQKIMMCLISYLGQSREKIISDFIDYV